MTEDELAEALIVARAIKQGIELRASVQAQCRILAEAVLYFMEPTISLRSEPSLGPSEPERAKERMKT